LDYALFEEGLPSVRNHAAADGCLDLKCAIHAKGYTDMVGTSWWGINRLPVETRTHYGSFACLEQQRTFFYWRWFY